jgi:hypothetical protein
MLNSEGSGRLVLLYTPKNPKTSIYKKYISTTYSHPYPQNMHNDFPILCTAKLGTKTRPNSEVQGPTPPHKKSQFAYTPLCQYLCIYAIKIFGKKNESY